jgi:hypothetical protein
VEADGDMPERQYLITLNGGGAEISEVGGEQPAATVRGTVAAWVRALGPEGSSDGLSMSGRDGLASAVLDGFAHARTRGGGAVAAA